MPLLFLVVAHVPDEFNCGLLYQTVRKVVRYHPGTPIVLIDNASPKEAATLTYDLRVLHSLNVSSSVGGARGELLTVIRTERSHGQLGALQELHRAMAHGQVPSLSADGRIVLLQHSTMLQANVHKWPAPEACPITGLGEARAAGFSNEMKPIMGFIFAVMNDLGFDPMRPQSRRARSRKKPVEGVPKPSAALGLQPLPWAYVPHGLLEMSREGWARLCAARLWTPPRLHAPDAAQRAPAEALPSIQRMWAAVDRGEVTLNLVNQAWERLVGMLVAWASLPNATLPNGALRCVRGVAYAKEHGGTFGQRLWRAGSLGDVNRTLGRLAELKSNGTLPAGKLKSVTMYTKLCFEQRALAGVA